jgi:leucyl-tRNA synthetase
MLAVESWPEWDPDLVRQETVTMIIQVNGKVRDRVEVAVDIDAVEAEKVALESAKVKAHLDGKKIEKVVVRPPNLVNVVAGQ